MTEHLDILEPKEIYALYGRPYFNEQQLHLFFEFTTEELIIARCFRTYWSKVYFLLQLGYFKAKQQFFIFTFEEVWTHASYLQQRYYPQQQISKANRISKPTRLAQQKAILALCNYKIANEEVRTKLLEQAAQLVQRFAKPAFVLRQLLTYLDEHRVVYPAYTTLQRLIEHALMLERKRLEQLLKDNLTKEEIKLLQTLVEDRSRGMYLLTWLQKEPPNFKSRAMREHAQRKALLLPFYELSTRILPLSKLSDGNIQYYATLAKHYTIQSLKQFQGLMMYLFLLCFASSQLRYINDILIESFRYYIRKYESDTKKMVKEYFYRYQLEMNTQLLKIPFILDLFLENKFDNKTLFVEVRSEAFRHLNKSKMKLLGNHIREKGSDKMEIRWKHYVKMRRKISYNLRFLFLQLAFETNSDQNDILVAAQYVRQIFQSNKTLQQVALKDLPQAFVPKHLKKYILKSDEAAVRYELFLYQSLRNAIEAGDVFMKASVQFKSLEDDLIALNYWEKHQQQIIQSIGLSKLSMSIEELLSYWKTKIDGLYKTVNTAIRQGDNPSVKIHGTRADGSTKWTLSTNKASSNYNHHLYKQFKEIEITDLLHWVNEQTNFIEAFTPVLAKGTSKESDEKSIYATLLAFATNHGLTDMANRCELTYYELHSTAHHFIRLETLQQANKIIVNASAKLPMFDYYNQQRDALYSSSDGQKFATTFDTINSRHSSKYFGLEKGVSVYTLMSGRLPINAKVMGANEAEAPYVFDLLYNNLSDIKPHRHATDTHGTNQVNFAILDFFGYQFAPRYKNFIKEVNKIGSFQSPDQHDVNDFIKPLDKFDTDLIIKQGQTIRRIIASLALKNTTQHIIVRKLSSFKRVNKAQKAFWEYNRIVKTAFTLQYIHDEIMRQNIENALDNQEGYHRLKKKVFYAKEGKFHVHSSVEQQVWSECARLVTNIIIYYNLHLLSQLLEHHQQQGNAAAIEFIKKVSPIAWRHINIYGRYRFDSNPTTINLDAFIKAVNLEKILKNIP